MPSICILTGTHLCRNPRVVKEASAISMSGHDVTVLGPTFSDELAHLDNIICESVTWKHEVVVDLRPQYNSILDRLALRLSRRLAGDAIRYLGWEFPQALGYGLSRMHDFALKSHWDLYIAHQETGLWVGCELLKAGKRVGADFEDWYSRDLLPVAQRQRPLKLLQQCEGYMLRHGAHLTTTSNAMADALQASCGGRRPLCIYNAFPWSDRNSLDHAYKDRQDFNRISLHWVSQTVGPGRGLEILCQALRQVAAPIELHIRGSGCQDTKAWLRRLFPSDRGHQLFFHDLVPPKDLLSRITEHDIGLALESCHPDSKGLTVSNKILHYLLAGLAVIASDTKGQTEIASQKPGAVRLFRNGNVADLANRLNALVNNPSQLSEARAAALAAAKDRFCWEHQVPTLVQSVDAVFRS